MTKPSTMTRAEFDERLRAKLAVADELYLQRGEHFVDAVRAVDVDDSLAFVGPAIEARRAQLTERRT